MRPSGRIADELRQVKFTRNFTMHAAGSVLVEFQHQSHLHRFGRKFLFRVLCVVGAKVGLRLSTACCPEPPIRAMIVRRHG